MLGAIIGGALALGGSIFGGISASNAMRARERQLKEMQRENQNWYDRRYNEDATRRADAQHMLTLMDENVRSRNRGAAGRKAVIGGTEESVASEKAANNEGISKAVAQIAASGEARKDAIEQRYMNVKNGLAGQQMDMEMERTAAMGQAVGGAVSALGQLGSAYDDWRDGRNQVNVDKK